MPMTPSLTALSNKLATWGVCANLEALNKTLKLPGMPVPVIFAYCS